MLQVTKAELLHNEAELQKQRHLNERLENDLLQLNTHMATPNGSARPSSPATVAAEAPKTALDDLQLGSSTTVSLISQEFVDHYWVDSWHL